MALVHQVKRIQFLNREVPVCLQNENGPCPLLALVNVLLLRGALELHADRQEVTSQQLIELVGNLILEKNPIAGSELQQANLSQTIDDVIQLLPTLQFGLDVNVKFSGISDFEFDSRISVFDLVGVNIFHGWVVDPQDEVNASLLGSLSYNQVMDKLIQSQELVDASGKRLSRCSSQGSASEKVVRALQDAELINKWLADTASQLTYSGLSSLHEEVRERELCAFFRNNHFSTMFKMDGKLYLLVTDQGYKESNVIAWERLDHIDGNTDLVSPSFGSPNEYVQPKDMGIQLQGARNSSGPIDPDELLALQIQDEEDGGQTSAKLQRERQARKKAASKAAKGRKAKGTSPKAGGEGSGDCTVM